MKPSQWLPPLVLFACLATTILPAAGSGQRPAPEPLVYVDADVFLLQLDTQLDRGGDFEVIFVGGMVNANDLPDRINTLFSRVRDAGGDIRIRVAEPVTARSRGLGNVADGVQALGRAVQSIEQVLKIRDRVGTLMQGNPYRGYSIQMDIDRSDATVTRLLLVDER